MSARAMPPAPGGSGSAGGDGGAPRPFDLVVFDLDGTLLDTAPGIAACVNAVLRERALPAATTARVSSWIGDGSVALMRRALEWAGGPPALLAACAGRYAALYREHARAEPFPGVVATLGALRDAGVHLAVASNKEKPLVDLLLARSGLDAYFGLVLGGDSLPAKKPDPLPLRHCLAHFRVAPGRALFVGDSALDRECAQRAGVACRIVGYGYGAQVRAGDSSTAGAGSARAG